MKSIEQQNKGFTLTELIVTIGIIVVLTAVILPNLGSSRGKARDAQRVSDIGQIQLALSLYYDRCGQFPYNIEIGISDGCPAGVNLGTFISAIPVPPTGYPYDYVTQTLSGKYVNYVLHATLESPNVAAQKGLSALPSWVVGTPFTCSNSSTSTQYCVTSN